MANASSKGAHLELNSDGCLGTVSMQTVMFNMVVSRDGILLLGVLSRTQDVLLKRPPVPAHELKFYLKRDEKLL